MQARLSMILSEIYTRRQGLVTGVLPPEFSDSATDGFG